MLAALPELREITLSTLSGLQTLPTLKIKTDDDVEYWKTTQSYLDYMIFLRRLNESVVGYTLPWRSERSSKSVERMTSLLDILFQWIEEIPPLKTPQRFGNLAFRTWGQRLQEKSDDILSDFLGPEYVQVLPYIKPYFLSSFGSFTRMDYGTGHETSFALFLLCLTLVRFFHPHAEEERELVFTVFLQYLRLCWKLQDTYKLEPAGSHGVWGLDDYTFLPYIFGSGQLRDQTEIPVSSVLHPPLPPTNLYFMAIMRIHDVKIGPFFEHSSQLYSIASGVPNWGKVNSGLFKMYEAEVLGKRVVVQHIPLGGLLEWEKSAEISGATTTVSTTAAAPTQFHGPQIETRTRNTPGNYSTMLPMPATTAPWASSSIQNRTSLSMQPCDNRRNMPPPPLPAPAPFSSRTQIPYPQTTNRPWRVPYEDKSSPTGDSGKKTT
ncbi:Phosphotyrosyl phosphatase activator [Agrocybe pediades]|nr:Phosphotyrosyl phosphatase activator [Agrocybe pediades]